jgi:Skp family chaperone for outer membrane proteins
MKNIRTSARVLLVAAMIGAAMLPAARARAEMPTVAIVDLQKILNESAAAKDIQSQLDKQKEAFRKEVATHEQELKTTEEALSAQKGKMPEKEFAAKVAEFQTKYADTRTLVRKRQASLEKAANTALIQLRKEVGGVVTSIATEKKYDLVLSSQDVIWAQSAMDITEAVRTQLDKKVSKIPLKVEK